MHVVPRSVAAPRARSSGLLVLLAAACAIAAVTTLAPSTDRPPPAVTPPSPPAAWTPPSSVVSAASSVVSGAPGLDERTAPQPSAPEAVVVEGVVVDVDGRPIADAEVTGGERAPDRVSPLGTFRLQRPRGVAHVVAPGYLPARLQVDGPLTDLRVVLVPPAAIRGVVRDAAGPVAGARVSARRSRFCGCRDHRHALPIHFQVESDAHGRFAIDAASPGVWEVAAQQEERWSQALGLRLRAGTTTEAELRLHDLQPELAVTARTAGGVTPIARPEVLVDGRLFSTLSFSVGVPRDVDLEVRVGVGALRGRATVPRGTSRVEVELEPSRRLHGRVLRPRPPRPAAEPARPPRRDPPRLPREVDVELTPDGDPPLRFEGAETRERATCRLGEGEEEFAFDVPIDRGGTLEVSAGDLVLARRRVEVGETDVLLTAPGFGALLWPQPEDGPRDQVHASTGGAGFERVPGLFVEGPAFVVVVRAAAGLAGAGWVDVRAGELVDVALQLGPATRVRGRIVDASGRGLRSSVEAAGVDAGTGPDGHFELLLPPGRFRLIAGSELDEVLTGRALVRPTLREVDVGAEDVDLGDLVVQVE